MIKTIFLLSLLLLCAWLGVALHGNPGYVLIATSHWRVESTLWVAVAAVLLLFSALYCFFALYHRTIHLPHVVQQWRIKRRALRAHDRTTQGLIAFSEGYFAKAKTSLIKALPNTETPLINYLIAARAAQELGENKLRDQYLREAQQSMPDAKVAVALTQAQLQLAHKQWEQALATLRHLHDLAPTHPYVLKLLSQLYEAIEDWTHLITLLPSINKHHVFTTEQYEALTKRAYLGALNVYIQQGQLDKIDTFIKSLPKNMKYNAEIVAAYAKTLIAQDKNNEAELILRHALQKAIAIELIEVYSTLPITTARTEFIATLLKQHIHKDALHLCLGKLYLRQQLYGKAQAQLEASLKLKPSTTAYLALGDLFEKLEDKSSAYRAYKSGINYASTG